MGGKFCAGKIALGILHLKRTLRSPHQTPNALAGWEVIGLYSIREDYNRQFRDCKTLEMIED